MSYSSKEGPCDQTRPYVTGTLVHEAKARRGGASDSDHDGLLRFS